MRGSQHWSCWISQHILVPCNLPCFLSGLRCLGPMETPGRSKLRVKKCHGFAFRWERRTVSQQADVARNPKLRTNSEGIGLTNVSETLVPERGPRNQRETLCCGLGHPFIVKSGGICGSSDAEPRDRLGGDSAFLTDGKLPKLTTVVLVSDFNPQTGLSSHCEHHSGCSSFSKCSPTSDRPISRWMAFVTWLRCAFFLPSAGQVVVGVLVEMAGFLRTLQVHAVPPVFFFRNDTCVPVSIALVSSPLRRQHSQPCGS